MYRERGACLSGGVVGCSELETLRLLRRCNFTVLLLEGGFNYALGRLRREIKGGVLWEF